MIYTNNYKEWLLYHGREEAYSIQYHIVWDVKCGHKILTKDIEENLIKILNKQLMIIILEY